MVINPVMQLTRREGRHSREDNDTAIKASMLHVMQANVGSLLTNLHEFRSRLAQQQPDIVLLQEDGIHDSTGIHFLGYFWAHQAQSVPWSTGPVRGGGVSILVHLNGLHRINYEQLPTLNLGTDSVTEIIRVRLYFYNPMGLSLLDIVNIYQAPGLVFSKWLSSGIPLILITFLWQYLLLKMTPHHVIIVPSSLLVM